MKFEPQILSVNHERIEKKYRDLQSRKELVNKSLEKIKDILQLEFNDEDLKELVQKGDLFIQKCMEKPFPDADLNFNLQATGKVDHYVKAIEEVKNLTSLRFQDDIIPVDGKFGFIENLKEKITKRHTLSTQNEKQNEVLQMAKEICKVLNTGRSKGYYDFTPYAGLSSIPFIKYGCGQEGFIPNHTHIRDLK